MLGKDKSPNLQDSLLRTEDTLAPTDPPDGRVVRLGHDKQPGITLKKAVILPASSKSLGGAVSGPQEWFREARIGGKPDQVLQVRFTKWPEMDL